MEIIKYKKVKNNIYELDLSNGTKLKLYDDVIVKYNLLINKKLDDKLLLEISKYNDSLEAYYISLKYLNKRLRCEKEIRKYLEKLTYSTKIIDDTINKLNNDGYLNHEIYIKSYINDSYNLNATGPDKVKKELINLGFTNEEIDPFIDKDYTNKIKNIIDKKVKANHKYSNNILKQNISNYLINLGYPKELFIDYLEDIKVDNTNLIKKDYLLLKKKYEKKYDKDKLKYYLKNKLYQKGYSIEEISEVLNELL